MLITPDSQRLVLALARSGQVVVIDLRDESITIAGSFKHGLGLVGGRVVKGGSKDRRGRNPAGQDVDSNIAHGNGIQNSNGHAEEEDEEDDYDEEEDDVKQNKNAEDQTWVKTLAASEDGQWLGVGDLTGSISIYNLDTLRVRLFISEQ